MGWGGGIYASMSISKKSFLQNCSNVPSQSCSKPLFQSEARCGAIDLKKKIFHSHANKFHLHKKVLNVASFLT